MNHLPGQMPMIITDPSTPVLILASPHHGGLGITRSFGRLGIPVFNVDAARATPAFFSRYSRGKFIWDIDSTAPAKSVEFLMRIPKRAGRPYILIPTTDTATVFVAENAEILRQSYLFPEVSPALIHSLCDKREVYHVAQRLNISIPRTEYPRTKADLLHYFESCGRPVMIKGSGVLLRRQNSKTKFVIRSAKQLLDLCARMEEGAVKNVVVQEYISDGEDWMFNGYFDEHSHCLAGFTGRKLRQCPAYTGVTSLGLTQKNETIARIAKRLVQSLGFRGIVDIDFSYDARAGEFKLLDVNPRIGSTFRLFVSRDDLDVARALYLHLTGRPVPPQAAAEGRKWIVEDLDLAASLRYALDGKLTLRQWVKSLSGIREAAFCAADDPAPVLLMLWADLRELWRWAQARRCPAPPFDYEPSPAPAPEYSEENVWS
ncbi:MAG TPA: ATP-grasp domain-containing protein [Bryobacterales bacterium]|nr:ATP-grasp domain-containing protein [Bryobacterales bacterium]